MTEGRVPAFNHEVVPNYLRTKAEPEVEERELQIKQKAATIAPEQAQVNIKALSWFNWFLISKTSLKGKVYIWLSLFRLMAIRSFG